MGNLEKPHFEEALNLVLQGYREEGRSVPFLPPEEEVKETISKQLKALIETGKGVVALRDGELKGFLAGFSVNQLFGSCSGVYIPIFGNGASRENRQEIFREMYIRAAENWVGEKQYCHAITTFAHHRETIDNWFWLGFGLRCVDGIRKAERIKVSRTGLEIIKKAGMEDLPLITPLYSSHCSYYSNSPIFMPVSPGTPLEELKKWLAGENHHLWFALREGKPAGYIQIEPVGETFVSRHPSVMNITGAYVEEKSRGKGIGKILLSGVQDWLIEKGYSLCGVDFESFNPAGSVFWNSFFSPYTFSLVRRIDERVGRVKKNA